ncbi:hypothetical protein [Rhodovibrio sodomensis]|uniref:hypothetical protein n=1 Tax=Rhodovibrio sodomensis TaxID=1088 RepID=UPI0019075BD3|nr:hypothetical protein [Rhodovibrio sodomensis]
MIRRFSLAGIRRYIDLKHKTETVSGKDDTLVGLPRDRDLFGKTPSEQRSRHFRETQVELDLFHTLVASSLYAGEHIPVANGFHMAQSNRLPLRLPLADEPLEGGSRFYVAELDMSFFEWHFASPAHPDRLGFCE